MAAEVKKEIELEIAHVLFIDIVAYSKMATDDQRAAIDKLNQIVQSTDEFRKAESEKRLLKIATGDGMALIFYHSPEDPVECALEVSRALREQHPELRLLIGIFLFWQRQKPKTFAAASVIPEKSVAVLPFANLSRDPDNAYFADGIQDEILTRLSKIADLKVISRTSTQHYKSAPENLPEIARLLGVAHVLEGTVQKSADAVRVNVQLIKA